MRGVVHTPESFWARVQKTDNEDECWLWEGSLHPTFREAAYGTVGYQSSRWIPGRLAYVLTYGPIPKGMIVRRRCGTRACCNPKHLYLDTEDHKFGVVADADNHPKDAA